ncbi:MAG: hypothetical protein M1814_001499 [Vezdaea aestivalis]|nr:MAG: hypothetical protein M1814_001499 [Vezdaea aestivalis]
MTEETEAEKKDGPHKYTERHVFTNGTGEPLACQMPRDTAKAPLSHMTEPLDEVDEFGLLIKHYKQRYEPSTTSDAEDDFEDALEAPSDDEAKRKSPTQRQEEGKPAEATKEIPSISPDESMPKVKIDNRAIPAKNLTSLVETVEAEPLEQTLKIPSDSPKEVPPSLEKVVNGTVRVQKEQPLSQSTPPSRKTDKRPQSEQMVIPAAPDAATPINGVSEWSHQKVVPQAQKEDKDTKKEDEWQEMPSFADYDLYNDDGKLIAREAHESEDEGDAYAALGGAGKGYTRVTVDEDAQSATSMDEDTKYLFKEAGTNALEDDDEEQRDTMTQMQFSKDLLTEGQRIAYVGVVRLAAVAMIEDAEKIKETRGTKKELRIGIEALKMWSQKVMVRLYAHMEISSAEQIMIEQLSDHGVLPADLTPALMQNARVKNPMAAESTSSLPRPSTDISKEQQRARPSQDTLASPLSSPDISKSTMPPPPYEAQEEGEELPSVRTPSQMPSSSKIDIDLRWTVLCDLFLVLIADSAYDSRSRVLLERVGDHLDVPWLAICKFEKRVTDALEMQEAPDKENWNEDDHKETRRKLALKRRYVMMGLATVGGSLVIGLSAGLLAPVIGAGLAAGFTTIGVAGTSGFLAGAGGAAIITSSSAVAGGIIAVRASNKRTGAVKTFEYRPLHNNKRVNLIVTVSGWMNGKVDDVRLPYSTVDPIMGDIYSVLWEPEVLQSVGQTLNIIATEALTQGLQQVLASTILFGLMSALQLPIILSKLSYLIDNPWNVSVGRAEAAGLILADSLIDRNLGVRPVTLVGYSLGSRVIFSCLKELAAKGAYGIVQNVYIFGAPVVAKKDEFIRARMVVAGRFVNGYARNDWLLGYLFRATSGGLGKVAGLAPVEDVPGLENLEVTTLVNGHFAYRTAMPRLLRELGFSVESDEFVEIEEPDPENHQERQRELIAELDEARKNLAAEPEKKKFGMFSRKKNAKKQTWETYDESSKERPSTSKKDQESGSSLLFDIEAIRRELESEHIEVRELESTMPTVKINTKRDNAPEKIPSLGADFPPPRDLDKEYPRDKSIKELTESILSIEQTATRPEPGRSSRSSPARFSASRQSTDEDGEEITMSFEPLSHSKNVPSPSASPTPRSSNVVFKEEPQLHHQNPPYRRSISHDSFASKRETSNDPPPTLEHNAWADEDEFAEREVTMSFE